MNSILQDMYGHLAWADAEQWRAIGNHEVARGDTTIHQRLHHIHLVQRGFMWIIGDRSSEFVFSKPEDFDFDKLKEFAVETHALIHSSISHLNEARLQENIHVPWFPDPPLTISITEALTQCAMHSQWHRGQNATRLRELGGEPTSLDLIFWIWKNRPVPNWK